MDKEQEIQRTASEKEADRKTKVLEEMACLDGPVGELIWEYFHGGHDKLALMLLQNLTLDKIYGEIESIQMTLDRMTDDSNCFHVNTYDQT